MSASTHSREREPGAVVERPDLVVAHMATMREHGIPAGMVKGLRIATMGKCRIIVAQEQGRWHLSISHPWRLPTWDEINAARDAMIPADVWLCQPMPPKAFWINLHAYCLHLWEVHDRQLLEQWAFDGCRDEGQAVAEVAVFLAARGAL